MRPQVPKQRSRPNCEQSPLTDIEDLLSASEQWASQGTSNVGMHSHAEFHAAWASKGLFQNTSEVHLLCPKAFSFLWLLYYLDRWPYL